MWAKLSARDRRALWVAAAAVVLFLTLQYGVLPFVEGGPTRGGGMEDRELTLQRYLRLAGSVEAEQAGLAAARERLKNAELALLESPSAALANAEWQRLVRELAEGKGIRLVSSEFLRLQEVSPDYALVSGRVRLACKLDQLVDFLVSLGTSPKLLSATRLRIAAMPGDAEKRLNVEMTIAAVRRGERATKASQAPSGGER